MSRFRGREIDPISWCGEWQVHIRRGGTVGRSLENISHSVSVSYMSVHIHLNLYNSTFKICASHCMQIKADAPWSWQWWFKVLSQPCLAEIWKKREEDKASMNLYQSSLISWRFIWLNSFFPASVKSIKDRLNTKEKIKIAHLFSRVKMYLFSKS